MRSAATLASPQNALALQATKLNAFHFTLDQTKWMTLEGFLTLDAETPVALKDPIKLGIMILNGSGTKIAESRGFVSNRSLIPHQSTYFCFNAIRLGNIDASAEPLSAVVDLVDEGRCWYSLANLSEPALLPLESREQSDDIYVSLAEATAHLEGAASECERWECIIAIIHCVDAIVDAAGISSQAIGPRVSCQGQTALQLLVDELKPWRSLGTWLRDLPDASLLQLLKALFKRGLDAEIRRVAPVLWRRFEDADLRSFIIQGATGASLAGPGSWLNSFDLYSARCRTAEDAIVPFSAAFESEPGHLDLFRTLLLLELDLLAGSGETPSVAAIREVVNQDEPTPSRDASISQRSAISIPPIVDPIFRFVKFLAFSAPKMLRDLASSLDDDRFRQALEELQRLNPTYLIVTWLGYPMGGGEAFMRQTCRVLSEFGINCVWVSFANREGHPNREPATVVTPYYLDVRRTGGLTSKAVEAAVADFKPDVIHCQGPFSEIVEEMAETHRIPVLVGFHFWTGLVDLGSTGNKSIVKNKLMHRAGPLPKRLPSVTRYLASEFMQEVLAAVGGRTDFSIFHPTPDPAHYLKEASDLGDFVLQINIVPLKGGEILLECIRALGQEMPFLVVESEPGSDALFQKIRAAVAAAPGSRYLSYGDVKTFYSDARIVLVPTLVDETFCRVAFEAAMNGIPVFSTNCGFLATMFGETGHFLSDDPQAWVSALRRLYDDKSALRAIGLRQRARLLERFGLYPKAFVADFFKALERSPRRNIGFMSSWGDQGLGNLVKLYTKLFRTVGWKAHIISFQAYASSQRSLTNQQNPSEWSVPKHADSVYYSYNNREEMTRAEIEQFVFVNNIGTIVYPEICWEVNWDKILSVSVKNLAICASPMIEIVRRREAHQHNLLARTWFNTRIAQSALTALGITNGTFIGHGTARGMPPEALERKIDALRSRDRIRFLHIGGHNPLSRKQTPLVLAAFRRAALLRNDIELTVTSMGPLLPTAGTHEGIKIIDETLSHDEVINLYADCDVSIQVSSHEGLGLGFYESISQGTPVISLDVPPHNEPIVDGVSGWLLPVSSTPLPDNDDGVVLSATFDPGHLTSLILRLSKSEIAARMRTTEELFKRQFEELSLLVRLVSAVP